MQHHYRNTAILMIPIVFAAGCSSTPIERLGQTDVIAPAVVGAVVGGLVGYFIQHDAQSAAIGAGVGALAGGAIGVIAAERREKYATQQEYYDSEIASANSAIASKERELADLETSVQSLRTEVDSLEQRRQAGEKLERERSAQIAKINDAIEKNNETCKRYQDAIAYLEEALKEPTTDTAAQQKHAELTEKKQILSNQYQRLLAANSDLEELAGRLRK